MTCRECDNAIAVYCGKCVDAEREELNRLRRLVPSGTYTLNVAHEEEIQRLKDAGEVLIRSLERMTRERDDFKAKLDAELPAAWREDVESLNTLNERLCRERDEAKAELAFIEAEYASANESDLTRDALCLQVASLKALIREVYRELLIIEAITVSPSNTDGLIELCNRLARPEKGDAP